MEPVIELGSVRLPTFGVVLVFGWVAVLAVLAGQARRHRLSYGLLFRTTLVAFTCALAGSRLLYVLLVEPSTSVVELFQASRGTMYYGFLIGAAIGSWSYLAARGMPVLPVLDACIPAWLPMQIAGRIGCFLAGCCHGSVCDLPWAVTYDHPLSQAPAGVPLHPTQLYEAIAVAGILAMLVAVARRHRAPGSVTFAYLASYSVIRFLIEILRADERGTFAGGILSVSQGVSLLLLPIAAVGLWHSVSRRIEPSMESNPGRRWT